VRTALQCILAYNVRAGSVIQQSIGRSVSQLSKQMSKVIWQKAASLSCNRLRLRMYSSDLDPRHMVPWTYMSQPTNGISIGSPVFAHLTVHCVQAMRPKN